MGTNDHSSSMEIDDVLILHQPEDLLLLIVPFFEYILGTEDGG